jgi:hypothetical protein
MPVITALGRLREKELKFKASLDYTVRLNLIQTNEQTIIRNTHAHTHTHTQKLGYVTC